MKASKCLWGSLPSPPQYWYLTGIELPRPTLVTLAWTRARSNATPLLVAVAVTIWPWMLFFVDTLESGSSECQLANWLALGD